MRTKITDLRATLDYLSEVSTAAGLLESQNLQWTVDQVMRNLGEDDLGTFGIYRRAKLRSAYQPIVSITHRRVVGYEALLRPHLDDGSVSNPAQLLAQSTACGEQLIVDRVSRAAHVANYTTARRDAWLFLNIHPDVFNVGSRGGSFPQELLDRYEIAPHQIVLELLEHQTFDETAFQEAAVAYREQGFLLAIDDFGAGQSNFDRIWSMHPDFVKLDRSLVQRAEQSPVQQRILRHMVALLHQAGTMVVAEGVETRRQALVMMEADVDFLQGFWLSRPGPVISEDEAVRAVLRLNEAWDGFAHYDETITRGWRHALKPFKAALKTSAAVFQERGSQAGAASVFFSIPGALTYFILDERGVMTEAAIPNPRNNRRDRIPHLKPLQGDVGSNWSRRAYFKQALRNPGNVVLVGPHYSLMDGQGVYTAAMAVPSPSSGRTVVLCGDFELEGDHAVTKAPRIRGVNDEGFDPTLSLIGLASGAPRGPR